MIDTGCRWPRVSGSHRRANSSARGLVCRLLAIALIPLIASCNTLFVPDMTEDPVDSSGYEIQRLSTFFAASFVRGDDVYLLTANGKVLRESDSDLSATPTYMGSPFSGWGRSIFVSSTGAIFASGDHRPLYRTNDDGLTYTAVLDSPVWRMDEDDEGSLYAGNYIKDDQHIATLYKSTDSGDTWSIVFTDADNQHIHTVRWDDDEKRLYIAYGDGETRGQAYSDDRGVTWHVIASGPDQGHTDLAFTNQKLIWASDDQSGRVLTVDEGSGQTSEAVRDGAEFMWFAVSSGNQVFVGTAVSDQGQHAALIASSDGGATWQKILQSPETSTKAYSDGMIADSRFLSAGGWLYFTRDGASKQSYRVRKISG